MKFLVYALMLLASPLALAGRNVLLIIADDYGVDSSSLYNTTAGATAPTPRINALAASGVRFSEAYACPVCSPTRACLITGRHGFRTGVGEAVSVVAGNSLPAAEVTLPEVISQNPMLGIQSACFGKWHLTAGSGIASAPNSIGGWPHFSGSTGGALTSYTSWAKIINGAPSTSNRYATSDVVDDAVAWITARTTAGQPWVAWVSFNAPHTPFHAPPVALHSYGANPATNLLKYRAAAQAMDTEIARLLLAVNLSTTDILFMGDNGTPGQVAQAPYDNTHAKDTLYEGGIRVPLIISGPDVVNVGRSSDALVHAVDLFSTMLELAGVPLPSTVSLDSKSLVPVLANTVTGIRSRVYTDQFDQSAVATGGRVLRDDRYKITRNRDGTERFHDLLSDPAESTNLVANGISAMSTVQQARYYRLRYELGKYSTAPVVSVASFTKGVGGFSLTVPEDPASTQTMWFSSDLDFWSPVVGVSRSTQSGNVIFNAPPPLPAKGFYSVLSETP